MNFGKLLGVGKSIVNGGKSPTYREDRHTYLPKFISPKNPFATATQAELPQSAATESVAPAKKQVTPSWVKTQKIPEISGHPKSLAAWTSKLNPSTLFRDSGSAVGQRAVQAELSLEKVKVVHNDLTDAEVEVVPLKSRPVRTEIPELPPAKQAWELLGERLLRVTAL